ncbi:MAG: phosphocholine cytidylyltransferase family protein [Gammaproteobacteria bacterium]|nr:phosphocholine cytidylyltransferase family protein [Gammaproteobacteria bacterium]
MQAIILAAGVGNRLGVQGENPKSLLVLDGETLLSRHLTELAKYQVTRVTLCVGYREEQLRAAAVYSGLAIECVTNSDFRRGSVVSLWSVRAALACGESVLLMDADVLYSAQVLETLVASPHANCFLLDRDFVPGDEPVKLRVRGDRLVEFRKRPDPAIPFDFQGESVGFFKFSPACARELAQRCDAYVASGRLDEAYEEPIRDLVLAATQPLAFEDISGLPWIEIDFPEDIVRAEREVLPKIARPIGSSNA